MAGPEQQQWLCGPLLPEAGESLLPVLAVEEAPRLHLG